MFLKEVGDDIGDESHIVNALPVSAPVLKPSPINSVSFNPVGIDDHKSVAIGEFVGTVSFKFDLVLSGSTATMRYDYAGRMIAQNRWDMRQIGSLQTAPWIDMRYQCQLFVFTRDDPHRENRARKHGKDYRCFGLIIVVCSLHPTDQPATRREILSDGTPCFHQMKSHPTS
ncbi:MAG: hypothetical protein V2G42_00380 [bacterium JZ-2024 1]